MADGSDVCGHCGQRHVRNVRLPNGETRELPTCSGHVTTDRATYVKGQDRKKLDKPRPCGQARPRDVEPDWKCHMHGAAAPQVKRAAEKRAAEANAERILSQALADAYGDEIPDVPPAEAMLRAVSWTYAEVTVLRRKVAELGESERVWGVTREKSGGEDHGTTEEARPNIWWSMLRESMRDLVKFAAAARAAGCDEARVKLAQQQGTMLADVIRAILGDLGLTAEQQALVSTVVPRHLRSVAS